MAKKKNCRCALQNKITCPNCSNYKMVMLLKNGCEALKYETPSGQLVNPVWYSHLQYNGKTFESTKEHMINRFKASKFYKNTNVLMFFHKSGVEMDKTKV